MKKVLITGGAGFIGSHLADRMLQEGNQVTVVDDLSNGRVEFLPKGCAALWSDLADPSVLRFVEQTKFDIVYHLAAKPRVSYSVEHPAETNDENVGKTVKLLEACRGNVGRFVFTSSSSIYGDAAIKPTPESLAPNPQSPYALQKMVGEKYCEMFSDLYGMDTAVVRPFNVFGQRQLANGPYGTVVSSWLNAIKKKTTLRSDGDGTQTRDMTHVSNVVDIFARVGNYGNKLQGHVFNAGTGVSISNNEILSAFLKEHPEVKNNVQHAPTRAGDVKATLADMSLVQKQLGHSTVTDFWSGLNETYAWCMDSDIF
jgi:nucleoside-diphosphate-sugar epimerase